MTELSPFHCELRQDLIDYEAFQAGLLAYERISGIPPEKAMLHLSAGASKQQLDRATSRCDRALEFYKLPTAVWTRACRSPGARDISASRAASKTRFVIGFSSPPGPTRSMPCVLAWSRSWLRQLLLVNHLISHHSANGVSHDLLPLRSDQTQIHR